MSMGLARLLPATNEARKAKRVDDFIAEKGGELKGDVSLGKQARKCTVLCIFHDMANGIGVGNICVVALGM